ncbi:MAG: cytochrome c maturation protein CcmE [Bacteroidia bacterium]|jgi:cytochrome c-type biogenesis protein CcmE|nr:cytochrome c maturation protein CcmE [Bacteroidia bacterium]
MKKTHIILIALISVAIGAIFSTYGDASTYENFKKAAENPDKEYHIVGVLNKNKPREYNPQVDANLFTFYMIDEAGEEKKVVYRAPEPADFERSEKIVIIGNINGEVFEADKILLKCPSKYNEGEIPKG